MKSVINFSFSVLLVASLTLWATLAPSLYAIPLAIAGSRASVDGNKYNQELPPAEKINVNTATFDALIAIPGIGPKTAEKILDYRGKVGQFKTIEDLLDIKGIGIKTLEKIRPFVTL